MMVGTQKILAARAEAKDLHEMDGWEKLRRIREIMQAEKPKDKLDPNERIRICYEMATHRPGGFDKIRRCAGRANREEEELAKSMTAMEGLNRLLHAPRQPKPRRPSALQRFMASHTWEGAPPWAWCPPAPRSSGRCAGADSAANPLRRWRSTARGDFSNFATGSRGICRAALRPAESRP